MAITNNGRIRVEVTGARGPRGEASGPLGAESVGAEEINGSPTETLAIRQKLGIQTADEIFAEDIIPESGFFPYMPNGFDARGDSQTVQVVPGVTGYRELVASRLGVVQRNKAVSGGSFMDWGKIALADTIATGDFSLILPGYNDLRANGENVQKAESYRLGLAANAAWCAIPEPYKQRANALRIAGATTGTWEQIPVAGYGMGIFSETGGSTLTFKATGSTVYIAGLSITTTGGSFTANVDGKSHVFTCARTVGNGGDVSTDSFGPALFRIPNLGDGIHNVTITVNGDGNVYLLWLGGSNSFGGKLASVLLGNTLRVKQSGQSLSPPYNNYTDAGQRIYSKIAERVAAELSSDGLNVAYVDAAGSYDPETQTSADQIHMAQTGQDNVAAAFLSAMDMRRSFAATSAAINGMRKADPFGQPLGAVAYKSTNQTGVNFTTPTAVAFNAELYDSAGFYNSTQATRLTVPNGVNFVKISAKLVIDNLDPDSFALAYILKNGADFVGSPSQIVESGASSAHISLGSSPPVPVVSGDYFEVFLRSESDTSIDLLATSTWFSIQVVS